ncbi:MAG: hypothetical protein H6740_14005 [Alphaproteobacteria bacterium]|nr:hypothetical protein [Alphaproteobacteria bacterium]
MRRGRGGQSTVEYMLVVSVLVIALVAIGWVFTEAFGLGAQEMMQDTRDLMQNGTQTGSNDRR